MMSKATLGRAYEVATGIRNSLSAAEKYAAAYLERHLIHLNEQGFDCPAAKVLFDEETNQYMLHIFDHERKFVPDATKEEPIVYSKPVKSHTPAAALPEPM